MDIYYRIMFFSDWHCGSGLASGANLDMLVVRDSDGFPYVPGKTVKGLLREAVEEITAFKKIDGGISDSIFGKSEHEGATSQGCAFFSDAELPEKFRTYADAAGLTPYLYRSVASTAIEPDGIAKDNSLRKVETVVPCTLEGCILNIPVQYAEIMRMGLKYVKRLGQNRNRGLGRCLFEIVRED